VKTSASCQGKKIRRVAHASIVSASPYLKELQEAKQTTLRGASVKRKLLKPDSERENHNEARTRKGLPEKTVKKILLHSVSDNDF
jgi:hypothetical protein